jgi:serine protease inhibitor
MAKKQPGGSTATLDSNVISKANNAFTTALYGKLAKKQGNLFFS